MPKRFALRRPPQAATLTAVTLPQQPEAVVRELPTEEELRTAAYHRWEAAGRPSGDGVEFWLAAEQEMQVR